MAEYPVNWPGVPGGPVVFSFPISTRYIVPEWRTNNRPGIIARLPRLPIQHENGNEGAYAAQDTVYLFNGAEGRVASWHATVDHMEGYVNLPANEVGWQASDGSGPGNMQGFAIELSQRSLKQGGAVKAKARLHAAEIMGRICVARLKGVRPAKKHRDYAPDAKWCPEYFLNEPDAWNQYVTDVNRFADDELRRMAGGTVTTPSAPLGIGDTIKVTADSVNVRAGWGLNGRLVFAVTAGDTLTIIDDNWGRLGAEYADGYTWHNVKHATKGTGWMAIGDTAGNPWVEKVVAPTPVVHPKPQPVVTYAKPMPVPGLLTTSLQKHDTAEGITTVNEHDFVFVADVIQFTAPTRARQYAGLNAPKIKADYQKGERAIAAWLVTATDGDWYYLLAGGDDEWARVRYTDTVRVSDAPLLGDDMP